MAATDPTFYRTPHAAAAAAPENWPNVAAFDPPAASRTPLRSSTAIPIRRATAVWSGGANCRRPETNSTISAGTHARVRCVTKAMTSTAVWNGAICSCRVIRSSNTYVLDTKPDPRNPMLEHTIEAGELAAKAGYSRPHTVHCGPAASSCRHWAAPTATTGPVESRSSTTTRSKSSNRGKGTAVPSSSLTTSGGTCSRTRSSPPSGHLRR